MLEVEYNFNCGILNNLVLNHKQTCSRNVSFESRYGTWSDFPLDILTKFIITRLQKISSSGKLYWEVMPRQKCLKHISILINNNILVRITNPNVESDLLILVASLRRSPSAPELFCLLLNIKMGTTY